MKEGHLMTYGKTTWLIGDGFWDSHSNGLFNSHESVCVLNTSDKDAEITMTLYFEDRDEMGGFKAQCGAKRTHHIRMDKLKATDGRSVPPVSYTHLSLRERATPAFSPTPRCLNSRRRGKRSSPAR